MPHVLLEGPLDLARLQHDLSPVTELTAAGVRKSRNVFLGRDAKTLLIETSVVEAGANRSFLTRVDRKKGGHFSVRIEPMTAVERTPGVGRAIAWLAERIRTATPGACLIHTNIPAAD